MTTLTRQRTLIALQMSVTAVLVGISLYMYNDFRTHRGLAAPQTLSPMQRPLQLPDKEVRGTVEINPNGEITQE